MIGNAIALESIISHNWFFVVDWHEIDRKSLIVNCVLHCVGHIKRKLNNSSDEAKVAIGRFVNDLEMVDHLLRELREGLVGVGVEQASHWLASCRVIGRLTDVDHYVARR